MKRKMISESRTLDLCWIEGKLVDVRKRIDDLITEYGEEAKFEMYWNYDDVSLTLIHEVLETELQAAKRIAKSEKAAATRERRKLKKEEAERIELARLLEKYGE